MADEQKVQALIKTHLPAFMLPEFYFLSRCLPVQAAPVLVQAPTCKALICTSELSS